MHHHGRGGSCCNPFVLFEKLFWAAAATCFLYASHRIADAIKLQGRLKALDDLGDELSDEEREAILRKVKSATLGL